MDKLLLGRFCKTTFMYYKQWMRILKGGKMFTH